MPHPVIAVDCDTAEKQVDEEKINQCLSRMSAAEEALGCVRAHLLDLCSHIDGKIVKDASLKAVPDVHAIPELIQIKALAASQANEQWCRPAVSPKKVLSPNGNSLFPHTYASKVAEVVDEAGLGLAVKPGNSCGTLPLPTAGASTITLKSEPKEIAAEFGITEDEAVRCVEAFKQADIDGSESVDIAELQKLVEELTGGEMSDKEYKDLLKRYDKDANGHLEFNEFLTVFVNTPMQKMIMLQHAIEDVADDTRAEMAFERMTPQERVERVGVPVSAIKLFLRKQLGEIDSCFAFPWSVALFLAYLLSVSSHFNVEQLYAVDTAISFEIIENGNFAFSGVVPFANGRIGHKNVYDVNTHADFWSWMSMGLVQIFWVEGFDSSEVRSNVAAWCVTGMDRQQAFQEWGWNASSLQNLPETGNFSLGVECPEGRDDPPDVTTPFYGSPATATFLMYHSVVGGVRMRQEYSELIECPGNDPELRTSVHSGQCVQDPEYWLQPELRSSVGMDPDLTKIPGHEPVFLLSRWNRSVVRQELRRLENSGWFNPRTAKVEVMLSTYNPHQGVITATFILFFQNRAGHIHKMIEPVSIWIDAYSSSWHYVLDTVWICLVLKIIVDESQEIMKHLRQLGIWKGLRLYARISNAVDWCSVMYSGVIVAGWILHCLKLQAIKELLLRANVATPGNWEMEDDRVEYFERVEGLARYSQHFRMLLALYPFVIVSRFFKAFSTQPRLAMVTNTLLRAGVDIAHFSVVFASIFVIYTASAHIMFGQELPEFANYSRSINTVFRIMLGDYGWSDAMLHIGRLQAGIWFWTFTWLVNLVLLNMLLAIIMDVYTAVKGEIGSDTDTLISNTIEIVNNAIERRKGLAMPLDKVLSTLDPTDLDLNDDDDADEELGCITVSVLLQRVPGLLEPQARSILLGALKFTQRQERGVVSLTDATLAIQHIDQRTKQMHWSLENCVHLLKMNAGLVAGGSGNRGRVDQAQEYTQELQEANRSHHTTSLFSRPSLRSKRSPSQRPSQRLQEAFSVAHSLGSSIPPV